MRYIKQTVKQALRQWSLAAVTILLIVPAIKADEAPADASSVPQVAIPASVASATTARSPAEIEETSRTSLVLEDYREELGCASQGAAAEGDLDRPLEDELFVALRARPAELRTRLGDELEDRG